jgi:hypothetical protein
MCEKGFDIVDEVGVESLGFENHNDEMTFHLVVGFFKVKFD